MMTNLGKALRAYRFMSEMSQKDIAAEIGIPASSLCRAERGKELSQEAFVKLLAWFGREPTPSQEKE